MSMLSKFLLNLLIAKGRRKIRQFEAMTKDAPNFNRQFLMNLIRQNETTAYGKKYGFHDIHSVEDFKKLVPFSTYDAYAPYIDRMIQHGETGLITHEPIGYYAMTTGSVDNPKKIPISRSALRQNKEYTSQFSLAMVDSLLGGKWKKGRFLNLMEVKLKDLGRGAWAGPISGRTVQNVKNMLPFIITSPNEVIFQKEILNTKYIHLRFALLEEDLSAIVSAFMTAATDLMKYLEMNWELLVDDIEKGSIHEKIEIPEQIRRSLEKKLKPNPTRAAFLRQEFKKGFNEPIIPRIWPNLACIIAIGSGSFSVYTEKMRYFSGNIPIFFSVYAASEAFMATCVEMEKQEFVLTPDGAYYEFLPVDQDNDEHTLALEELEVGKDYEIILTTLSGFYRYRLKDVIRVVGWHHRSPKIKFVYRQSQMVSIAGEKTTEESIAWAVQEFAKEAACTVVDFSVFADTDCSPGRYVIFVETEKPLPKEHHSTYAAIMGEKLGIANPSVGAKVKSGVLSKTDIQFLQTQTYALYRDLQIYRGMSANQIKPIRVLDTPVKEKFFFTFIDRE